MQKNRAFTLIELMVVVSIIALLLGMLMPSFKEVRRISKRTVCQKNLDQIGVGMHAYLLAHRDTFPYACRLPSQEKKDADEEERKPLPTLPEALKVELSKFKDVWACPADQNSMSVDGPDAMPSDRYFPYEGTSYEWESELNGLFLDFKLVRIYARPPGQYLGGRRSGIEILRTERKNMWMIFDFEAFHGGKSVLGSHNVLYTDLHVQSDRWKEGKLVGKEFTQPGAMPPPPATGG